jgi:hypothetical protein
LRRLEGKDDARDKHLRREPPVFGPSEKSEMLVFTGRGGTMKLEFEKDFVAWTKGMVDSVTLDGDMVFVGYGVQAPEYQWDDFKGMDVKGKSYWGLSGAVQDCQLLFLVGYRVANDAKMPEWKPKAEFKVRREASLRSAGITP